MTSKSRFAETFTKFWANGLGSVGLTPQRPFIILTLNDRYALGGIVMTDNIPKIGNIHTEYSYTRTKNIFTNEQNEKQFFLYAALTKIYYQEHGGSVRKKVYPVNPSFLGEGKLEELPTYAVNIEVGTIFFELSEQEFNLLEK